MMHTQIDYSKSASPNFDAVQDVMEWFGANYAHIAKNMSQIRNCGLFTFYCSFAGVQGFQVKAWYEHFHGQGSWRQEEADTAWDE